MLEGGIADLWRGIFWNNIHCAEKCGNPFGVELLYFDVGELCAFGLLAGASLWLVNL